MRKKHPEIFPHFLSGVCPLVLTSDPFEYLHPHPTTPSNTRTHTLKTTTCDRKVLNSETLTGALLVQVQVLQFNLNKHTHSLCSNLCTLCVCVQLHGFISVHSVKRCLWVWCRFFKRPGSVSTWRYWSPMKSTRSLTQQEKGHIFHRESKCISDLKEQKPFTVTSILLPLVRQESRFINYD